MTTSDDDAASGAAAQDRTLTSHHAGVRDASLGPGDRIDRYQLTALLGAGGMAVVYAADDLELHRSVAIKLPRHGHGADAAERALIEARAMAQLRHPNVVPVFDVGIHQGQIFLVMPVFEEGTLSAWLRAQRRPWRAVLQKFLLAARGLEAAHAAGLVHRDFKPNNVLLDADDEVRVSDFGLVHDEVEAPAPAIADETATRSRLRGTPAYMAPEQLAGAGVDARADQFSFCVALHLGLYGQRPFAASDADPIDLAAVRDDIRAARIRPAPPDRRVPRWLDAIVARGLRADPAARWPSMTALIDAIERGLGRRRRRVARAGYAIVALALAAAAAVAIDARRPHRQLAPALAIRSPDAGAAVLGVRPARLTTLGSIDVAALSPDGAQIAMFRRGRLLVMPAAGGDPRVLLEEAPAPVGRALSWSPDGRRLLLLHSQPRHYHLIDVATGAARELTHVDAPGGVLLDDDTVVAAGMSTRTLFFASVDPHGPAHACVLPGAYAWLGTLRTAGATIYVKVMYPNGATAWLATDRTCAEPRVVCQGNAFPVPGDRCLLLAETGDEHTVIEVGGDGRVTGPGRRVPGDATAIVGVGPDGTVVLTSAYTTWRLAEYGRAPEPSRDVGTGAEGAPHLALAPDRRRLTITDARFSSTYLASVDRLDDRSVLIARGLFAFAWSPDGTRLLASAGRTLAIIDVASLARRDLEVDDGSTAGNLTWLDDHRIAYLRTDHAAYHTKDLADGTTGDLLDPGRGWTFQPVRSPLDGTLAVVVTGSGGSGPGAIWLVAPDGRETLAVDRTARRYLYAWSIDGRKLWLADAEAIEQYDPRTRTRTVFRRLDLPRTTTVVDVLPLDRDRVLLETTDVSTDLWSIGPGT